MTSLTCAGELIKIAGANVAHVDVMDNHFSCPTSRGGFRGRGRGQVRILPVDAHLMIEDPDRWALSYAGSRVSPVTFHAEVAAAPLRLARELHCPEHVRALPGPATDTPPFVDILNEFDINPHHDRRTRVWRSVLHRTDDPEDRGHVRRAINAAGSEVSIQADGGISRATPARGGCGVRTISSPVPLSFGAEDAHREVEVLRELANAHTH